MATTTSSTSAILGTTPKPRRTASAAQTAYSTFGALFDLYDAMNEDRTPYRRRCPRAHRVRRPRSFLPGRRADGRLREVLPRGPRPHPVPRADRRSVPVAEHGRGRVHHRRVDRQRPLGAVVGGD